MLLENIIRHIENAWLNNFRYPKKSSYKVVEKDPFCESAINT